MGHAFDKFGPRLLMIPGSILLSATLFIMMRLDMSTTTWVIVVSYILLMISIAAIMMTADTNGFKILTKHLYHHRTTVITTLQTFATYIQVFVIFYNIYFRTTNCVVTGNK